MTDLLGLFANTEDQYGLPSGYLKRTAELESSLNPNAQNNNSSAGGLFQFLDSTAKAYGLKNKFDPVEATDAAGRLARDNAQILRQALGRAPTASELYLAHQQGGGGATKILANPDAQTADLVGAKASAYNGGDGTTAGQFANNWSRKFDDITGNVQAYAPQSRSIAAPQGQQMADNGAPQQAPGGLGGLGGFVQGQGFGNILQAIGASLLSNDSRAPFASVGQNLNALQALQARQAEAQLDHERQARQDAFQRSQAVQAQSNTDRNFKLQQDQADKKKWQVIGKDQYGNEQYGYPPEPGEAPAAPAQGSPQPYAGLQGQDLMTELAKSEPTIAKNVQAIVEGRTPYPTGMLLKTPYGQRLTQLVTQADPTFESGNATARVKVRNEFNSGGASSPAGQITFGNTAIQHAGEMSDALEEMKKSGGVLASIGKAGIPWLSYKAAEAGNSAAKGTPSGVPLANFQTAKDHFAEEVTKFYSGSSGSEAERKRALDNLDAAKSPEELHAAIQTEAKLMQSKVNALQERWRTGMGPLVPDFPLIHSKSQEALDRIKKRSAPPETANPQDGSYKTKNGVSWSIVQ